jgi:hypothetical protein
MQYSPGEIPKEWATWLVRNVKKGVPVADALKRLKIKGFVPYKNDQVGVRYGGSVSVSASCLA